MEKSNKEIFNECCLQIAAACEPFGYKYYKSKKKMMKQVGCFTAEVHFASSTYNIQGSYLEFNTSCKMINTATGKVYWNLPLYQLREGKGKVWNLAKERFRERELTEIIKILQEKFFPLAESYGTNIEGVIQNVVDSGWFIGHKTDIYLLEVLDLVADFGTQEQVTECVHHYIRHLPKDVQQRFKFDYRLYQSSGQTASTINNRKLIPFMVERGIHYP
ncbi:hypothetical protein ACE6ED_15420 [Paenibacillus sp. CN-4]|uniref:hypothetical protein n=1 Tax=Paenibacillus nanchangensis TaxID=3348343 RepID=UPI00397A2C18